MLSVDQQFDPYALPPFANKANKDLALQIQEKERYLQTLALQIDDHSSRADSMSTHVRNLKQEMSQSQQLNDAKKRQLETEVNLKKLSERETEKLSQDLKDIEKEIQRVNDQMSIIQTGMFKGTEKLDTIRSEMKMSEVQLKDWLSVQKEKSDDNMALQKYTAEDEAKIKDLNNHIERQTGELIKQTSLLDNAVTETQITRLELTSTTEQFRKNHQERLELVNQWEGLLLKIQKKDEAILDAKDRFLESKEEIRKKTELINSKQAFLDRQEKENKERSKKIANDEALLAKTRLEQSEGNIELLELQDQLYLMQTGVRNSSSEIVQKKSQIKKLEETVTFKAQTLEESKKKYSEVQARLEQLTTDTLSLEAKSKLYEALVKQEEIRNKQLDKELKSIREIQFKKGQEIFKLKQDQRTAQSEIDSAQSGIKMLNFKINKMDQEALKHQAVLYAQDFQIEMVEKKVRRLLGERSDEEKKLLEDKIKELKEKLEGVEKVFLVLNTQLKKIQDDLRTSKRTEENLVKEKNLVNSSMHDTNLYLEGATKQLASKIKEKENYMVEESMLRLELRKLRDYLNTHADEVYSLAARKLQLSLALEERNKEINIQRDMLRIQMKNAEEGRVSAGLELKERIKKVEHMKKRYEQLMHQLNAHNEEGDDSQEHTQAYYIIKAAQKKDELRREGDELDSKIKKAEKDVTELENTLKFMNNRNEMYKNHMYQAELNSKDVQHKEMLNQQYEIIMEKYKSIRADYQRVNETLEQFERQLTQSCIRESNLLEAVTILEMRVSSCESELFDQEAKKTRALKSISKIVRDYKTLSGTELSAEEEDLKLRFLKDKTNTCIIQLIKLGKDYPELYHTVQELFIKFEIQPPTQPVSRNVSRPDTASGSIDGASDTHSINGPFRLDRSSSKSISKSKASEIRLFGSVSSTRSSVMSKTPKSEQSGISRQSIKSAGIIGISGDIPMLGRQNDAESKVFDDVNVSISTSMMAAVIENGKSGDRFARMGRVGSISSMSSKSSTSSRRQ